MGFEHVGLQSTEARLFTLGEGVNGFVPPFFTFGEISARTKDDGPAPRLDDDEYPHPPPANQPMRRDRSYKKVKIESERVRRLISSIRDRAAGQPSEAPGSRHGSQNRTSR
jgi:hypothetical protein